VTDHVNQVARAAGIAHIPVHVLIETHALAQAFEIAALAQVECLSFGLMDFVSAHHGAIPGEAMRSPGQFEHPLVRAPSWRSRPPATHGKVPSHNVSTDAEPASAGDDARARAPNSATCACGASIRARSSRSWRPSARDTEIGAASQILLAAHENNWAPIRHDGQLHDRASYRYYWSLLQRAHRHPAPRPSPTPLR
jgi:citrate lyase subunit beta/citryl-CoA lyase